MKQVDARVAEADIQVRIKSLIMTLVPPPRAVEDIGLRRRAQLVAASSLALSVILLAGLLLGPYWLRAHAVFLVVSIPCYLLSRTKYYDVGSLLFSFGGLVYTYLSINLGSTPNLENAVVPWVTLWLIVAGAILTPIGLAIFGLTATFLTFGAPLYTAPSAIDGNAIRLGWIVLSISSVLYILRLYRDFASGARLHQLENENRELERTRLDLELHLGVQTIDLNDRTQEIDKRIADLESANQRLERQAARFDVLSRSTEMLPNIESSREFLADIARSLGQHFNFDHAGIYLLDKPGEFAVLKAAHGEAGQQMLEQNHRIQIGEAGAVGIAAATHQPFMSSNTDTNQTDSKNPYLLPDTRSALAIPIMGIASGRPIGVLDIQSSLIDAFTGEDQQFLSLLCSQMGLAIENILLRGSTQEAVVEAESTKRQPSRRGDWDRFTTEQRLIGYRYDISGTSPLTAPINQSERATDMFSGKAADFVGVPIELRGEVLGQLLVHAPAGKRWNEDELDMIRAVAERVALSAENARLFEETDRRAERERKVSEITSRIRSTNDPNEMIKKAVQELKSALGVSRVEVRPQRTSNNSDVFEA